MSNISILAPGKLTAYPDGSFKEVWSISFPLMLSMLSTNVMTFLDRLILSNYSMQSMNAAVLAGITASIFTYAAMGIAAISDVFVGQYNGANKKTKIGEPVWQMIWFSILTAFIFIPIGIWGSSYAISEPEYLSEGIPYFRWSMFFGAFIPMSTALSSFFVGRGEVKLVLLTTIWTNVLNVLLDVILIFGVKTPEYLNFFGLEHIIPAMGAKGAAVATGLSQVSYVIVLLIAFLPAKYRKTLGTGTWRINSKLFWQTIKTGLPNSLSSIIELGAWTVLAHQLASVSEAHMTIYSIGETFFSLFIFGFVGLQQGITTLAANYIGANQQEILSKILHAGVKLIFVVMLILFIPLYIFPDLLSQQFIADEFGILNEDMSHLATIALRWVWLYFLFDALSWITSGVLTAAGDTKFVMYMNGLSAWLFALLPTYLMITYFEGSPIVSWMFCALYGLMNTISYYLRYKTKRWCVGQALHVI